MNQFFIFTSLLLISTHSYAYLGPGMSGGVIAAFIGFIGALLLGIFGILYYPIKRALKKRKKKNESK